MAGKIKQHHQTLMPNSKIPSEVLAELNRQLNLELNAAQAIWPCRSGATLRHLAGFSRFFAKQAAEEREHAAKFSKHLLDRDAAPVLTAIPAPKQAHKTLLEVALQAQAMEQGNTQGIHAAYEAALTARDLPGPGAHALVHQRAGGRGGVGRGDGGPRASRHLRGQPFGS